jgi:hypothetical protein
MEPDEDGSKRVTVLFNAKDWKAIEREIKRRERERGYPVSVSDALRELVREHWTPAKASA